MKALFWLAPLALTLSACNLAGTPSGDVTGRIANVPSAQGEIRMALLGLSFGGVTNESNNFLTVTPNDRGLFGFNLPPVTRTSGYRLVAYADTNANAKYDAGEPVTKDDGKRLVYVAPDFTGNVLGGVGGLSQGWNLVQDNRLVRAGLPFSGYDLAF